MSKQQSLIKSGVYQIGGSAFPVLYYFKKANLLWLFYSDDSNFFLINEFNHLKVAEINNAIVVYPKGLALYEAEKRIEF